MFLGDGTYPGDPNGTLTYAETDVVAHELVHGIIDVTSQLYGTPYSSESPAIAEGVSDALGEAVEAFAYGPPVTDQYGTPLIPATGNDWGVATRMHQGTPLRWFEKPSKDGASQDSWFEGLGLNDPHYGNGPMNRAFYFLVNGATTGAGFGFLQSLPPGRDDRHWHGPRRAHLVQDGHRVPGPGVRVPGRSLRSDLRGGRPLRN